MTLDVQSLAKRFDRHGPPVLDGVSFRAPAGAITCLVGPSGAGKSTVLNIIAGLIEADHGQVGLDGRSLDALRPHQRPVTLLMQQPQLFNHLDVNDNVAFGLRVRGVDRRTRRARAQQYLKLVGVGHLADRSPRRLSGGEAQRVALARALAVQPQVLLADEPFASVDAPVRRELQDLIAGLQRRLGTTIVLVTHDMSEALALADHLVVLQRGRVSDCGGPAELYERPGSEHTARLVGFANRWEGTVRDGRFHLGSDSIEVCQQNALGPVQGAPRPSMWAIRPERVRLAGPGARNILSGTVRALRFRGEEVEARIEASRFTVVAHLSAEHRPGLGECVLVDLPAEHLVEVRTGPAA